MSATEAIRVEKIAKLLDGASKKAEEFSAEVSTLNMLLLNGETLSSLTSAGDNTQTAAGRYKKYLETSIKKTKEQIQEHKQADKFYRRDFLELDPLLSSSNPFWRNTDNWILTFFWGAIFIILLPVTGAITAFQITNTQKIMFVVGLWITVLGGTLFLVQNFA